MSFKRILVNRKNGAEAADIAEGTGEEDDINEFWRRNDDSDCSLQRSLGYKACS